MTAEEKMNVCLSYRHDFGLLADDDREMVLAELNEWLRALNNNGLVVVSRAEHDQMTQRLMRIDIDENRGVLPK